jgi:anti-sigma factor RsiW
MSCSRLEEIHGFLEGALDAAAARRLESHLAECSACRAAAEDRRFILQAAESLEPISVPEDFAAGVLARLEPAVDASLPRLTLAGWLAATAAGTAAFGAALAALAFLSGRGLGVTFASLGRGLLEYAQGTATAAVKLAKLVLLFLKIAREFAGALLEAVNHAVSLVGPGARAACFVAALALLAGGLVFWRRRIYLMENRHGH